jgi:integrase/recombinase XerD
MPKIRESNTKKIEDGIEALIFEFGADKFQSILKRKGLAQETITGPEMNMTELTLQDGKEKYFKSDSFFLLEETSKKTYTSDLNHFLEDAKTRFKTKNLSAIPFMNCIATKDLKSYVDQFKNPYTKARKCAVLRSFIRTINPEYYEQNKTNLKMTLKIKFKKSSAPKAFSKIQLAELTALSKIGPNGLRNYTMLWVLIGSGIRVSSLINLRIGDIDFKKQSLTIKAKGHDEEDEVIAKINKLGATILKDYIDFTYEHAQFDTTKVYEELYVFSTNEGVSPITARAVQIVIKNLVLKAKSIPEYIKNEKRSKKKGSHHYGPHSIRHSFAVYALESGVDIYTISKLLTHSSIRSTEIYLDLLDHQLKEAIEKHPFAKKEYIKLKKSLNVDE